MEEPLASKAEEIRVDKAAEIRIGKGGEVSVESAEDVKIETGKDLHVELGKETKMPRVERIARLKRLFERIAFASLFVDICISVVTLISINYRGVVYTMDAIYLLNYVLTAVVILSIIVFAAIFMLSHYDRITNALLLKHLRSRRAQEPQKH